MCKETMIELGELSEQQKNQSAIDIKKNILNLKQTHDGQLAETFKKISTKLEEVNKTTKNTNPLFFFKKL